MKPELKVFRIDPNVILPTYGTESSSCFDLCAHIFGLPWIQIKPKEKVLISTGLIFDIPSGYSLRLHPRSGLALKKGLTLLNAEGVVDEDYVEIVGVILYNTSEEIVVIAQGDRICQGELVKDTRCKISEIGEKPKQKTSRDGGFGSTGV